MLILFDIDLTLIDTAGAGMRALATAGQAIHGTAFTADGVEYGGRLDPLILHDLLVANSIEPSVDHAAALRRGYGQRLRGELENPTDYPVGGTIGMLAGVDALLGRVREQQDAGEVCLGLLTGNFPETGAIKLRHCGLEPEWFPIRIWGDDSPHTPPHRDHLPVVAMERYIELFARPVDPSRVVIVGDTPHDVLCALRNGCRVLGVATGHATAEQLRAAGAHRVVDDLTATDDIADWLLDAART